MTDLVVAGSDLNFDGAVSVGRTARIGIVSKPVLGAKLAVDAIENGGKLLGRVRIKHRAAGRVGHGFKGMFTGGVAAVFVFDGTNHDGVKERSEEHTSELQSPYDLVCRLLLEKKNTTSIALACPLLTPQYSSLI